MNRINKHIHLSRKELTQYIKSEHLLEQYVIEQIELELQLCADCSDHYMRVMEDIELSAQSRQVDQAMESIISQIEVLTEHELEAKRVQRKKWYEYSTVQFVAAASITGLLFISGFLSFISSTGEATELQTTEKKVWIELETPQWLTQWYSNLDLQQLDLFEEEEQ